VSAWLFGWQDLVEDDRISQWSMAEMILSSKGDTFVFHIVQFI
jgi:hypothetical protein